MWTQEIPWIGRRILMDLWAYKRWTAPVLISFKDPWTIVKSCIKSCCIYHFYHQHPSANVCYIHHKPSGWWYTYPSEKYELVRQLGWFFHSQYDGKVIMAPCPVTTNQRNSPLGIPKKTHRAIPGQPKRPWPIQLQYLVQRSILQIPGDLLRWGHGRYRKSPWLIG